MSEDERQLCRRISDSRRRINAAGRWAVMGLLLAGESTALLAQGAGDPVRGQRLFIQCQACHSLTHDAAGTVGPPLAGVIGRKAASVPGYSYSPALSASGLTWNDATLDHWLEHPNQLVAGTKMIFSGVPNATDRLSIIAFLKKAGSSSAQ
jgi:cytochrome c